MKSQDLGKMMSNCMYTSKLVTETVIIDKQRNIDSCKHIADLKYIYF